MSRGRVKWGAAVVLAVLLPASWAANPTPPKPTEPPEIEIRGSRFALPPSETQEFSPSPAPQKELPVRRQPVPSEAQRQAADKMIREVFEKDLGAAKKAADKSALAASLLKYADDTKNDPAGRYALFQQARALAVAAGDTPLSLSIVDRVASEYVMDGVQEKSADIGKLADAATSTPARQAIAAAALSLVEEAAKADDYASAIKLARLSLDLARKIDDNKLVKQITERGRELTTQQQQFAAVQEANSKLETDPNNVPANLTLGRWHWFVKNDPAKGMPYMARAADATLSAPAVKDSALPKETTAQLELADAWWEAGQQIKDDLAKEAVLARALYWYSNAAPGLVGLQKAKAEKRMAELKPASEKNKLKPSADIGATSKAAPPPAKASENAPPAVAKRTEFKGTMYVCGDDDFELAVNGKVVANGNTKPVSLPLTLKAGDVIAATATNKRYERGFMACWLAEDGRAAIMTCADTWRMFVPADPTKWMEVKPSPADPPAALGDPKYLNISEAAGWGAEPLWGRDPAAAFVYHVVTAAELSDLVPPPPDKDKPPAKSIAGSLHVCADDACDVAVNGIPVGASRFAAKDFKINLAPGDLITAKAINMQYEHGFLLVFVSEDEKAAFATNTATWGCYAPIDPTRWFRMRANQPLVPSVKGDMKYLKPDIAIGPFGAEPLWEPKAKNLSFFCHVVTAAELKAGK